jgi:hypothetical protein
MRLLGHWNWYAPAWLARFLPRHALALEGSLDDGGATTIPDRAEAREPVGRR